MASPRDMMALEKVLARLRGYSHDLPPNLGRQMRSMLPPSPETLLKGMTRNERRQLFKLARRCEAEQREAEKRAAARAEEPSSIKWNTKQA